MSSDYYRIEKAILYLEENFRDQPSLEDVARHLNLSSYHFQRLFKRWAGISPKRFVQFLTIEYAKQLLAESRSVLDTTYESGLSSLGRLHDLFVTFDAVTPGEFKTGGAGLQVFYGVHDSPFGDCLLAVTERGICDLSFVTEGGRAQAVADLRQRWWQANVQESSQATQAVFEQVFLSRTGDQRAVTLYLRGTNFQVKVWQALLKIPPGSMCSYEDVSHHIGMPAATRAVGNAVASNPVAYIIPCHRVIRKAGISGNYRWNPTRKKVMLGWEAAQRCLREGNPSQATRS